MTLPCPPSELRMFIVVRQDLVIPRPKLGGQTGHAVSMALADCIRRGDVERAHAYMFDPGQAKIVCRAKTLDDLLKLRDRCAEAGLPHALVTDEARTVFPEPTTTCLGIGPLTPDERAVNFVKRLQILPE